MTTEQVQEQFRIKIKKNLDTIYTIAQDPNWANPGYKLLIDTYNELQHDIKELCSFNGIINSIKRDKK